MQYLPLEKRLDYKPHSPISLGCSGCAEFKTCGGMQSDAGLFDCLAFCNCQNPDSCQYVCPKNLKRFVERANEIKNFDFDNVPSSRPLHLDSFPLVIPVLFHRSSRVGCLNTDTVAIPLKRVIDYKNKKLRFQSKEQLAQHFKFNKNARLVITGVDKDRYIEPYWSNIHGTSLIEGLHQLQPSLITAPNYSIFLDAPRFDHMHNMKRTLICWAELNAAGIPASLHINALTDRDWERWLEFIGNRSEVKSISVEFGTGLARKESGKRYIEKLLWLAYQVDRGLQIILRGGVNHIRELSQAFESVTLLDTTSFVKTIKRKRLHWKPGLSRKWQHISLSSDQMLDELLQFNHEQFHLMMRHQLQQKKQIQSAMVTSSKSFSPRVVAPRSPSSLQPAGSNKGDVSMLLPF